MDMIRVRVHVTGLVQGVSFRDSTRRRASELGLSGWVRNAHDGSVWLEAQGPAARVHELVDWCRGGPPAARVDALDVHDLPVCEEAHGFEIRYGAAPC